MPDFGSNISQSTRDLVVKLLWIPPIIVLFAGSVAIAGVLLAVAVFTVRWAATGAVPKVAGLAGAIDPTLLVLGAGVVAYALGRLYLALANETFGRDTMEAAAEQQAELADELEDDTS